MARSKTDRAGVNRWRVVVRTKDGRTLHTSPWDSKKSAEHALKNHRAMNKDIGLGMTVELEEWSPGADKRSHMTKATTPTGEFTGFRYDRRSYADAADSGDAYQIETLDGKYRLFTPGVRGKTNTIAYARWNWPHRKGERVRIMHVLPGSSIGNMKLKKFGEVTL